MYLVKFDQSFVCDVFCVQWTDSVSPRPQVLCVRICIFYSTMCLSGWPLSSEAAKLRCGTDLLSDLIFVCGDRGIYLGKSIFMQVKQTVCSKVWCLDSNFKVWH